MIFPLVLFSWLLFLIHLCQFRSKDIRLESKAFLDDARLLPEDVRPVNASPKFLTCGLTSDGPQFLQGGQCVPKCVNQMANVTDRTCKSNFS